MIPGSDYDVVNKVPMTKFKGLVSSNLYFINTKAEFEAFYELLMQRKIVACDTETTGFHYYLGDRIVGMSFGWDDIHFYIPTRHVDSELGGKQPPQLSMDYLRPYLQKFFARTDVFTIWHNAKFDIKFYKVDGIEVKTPFYDTRILWQLFDENAPGALKVIASGWRDELGNKRPGLVGPEANEKEQELSNWRTNEAHERRRVFRELVKTRADELRSAIEHQDKTRTQLKQWIVANDLKDHPYVKVAKSDIHYGFVPADLMTEYAATDTYLTYVVYRYVMSQFPMSDSLKGIYVNELKLSQALTDAEYIGSKIDRPYLEELGRTLDSEIAKTATELKAVLGDINLGSNVQLANAFIAHGIPLTKKTPAGNFAVDKKVLDKLKKEYDVVSKLLSLRALSKLKNTYVTGILSKLTDEDVLHCSFNQNVTTGRMSSRDPNLQNIPGRDDSIRKAFILNNDEYVYLFADYSQVEVRLTAHYSEDPLLLDAYAKGQDVHTRTMCEMFGHDYDHASMVIKADDPNDPAFKIYKADRNIAKRINFGIIYGVGAPGLSEQIPRPEMYADYSEKAWINVCQDYIDGYLEKYRGVRKFINRTNREVRKSGVVYNHFGRPRRLPHALIKDRSKYWMVGRAERQATNFKIQGTAADIFKIAVVRVADLFEGQKSVMVNFVHDEIQAYVHKDELNLLNEMKHRMEDFDFKVPLLVDMAWSTTSWAAKREIG